VAIRRPGAEIEEYVLGEVDGRHTWGAAAERPDYLIHVLTALAVLGGDEVAVGLPLGQWMRADERRAIRSAIAGIEAEVRLDGVVQRVRIGAVRVLPQGVGAAAWAMHADPALEGRPLGIIDVGYRTTDYLMLRRGDRGLVPVEDACGTTDLGVGQVYAQVRDGLPVQVPEGAVESALRHYEGRMWVRGQAVDLAPAVAKAAAALAGAVRAVVLRAWGDRADALGGILLAGGGGAVLSPHLGWPVVPDPEYANALGYLLLCTS
jgi:plasmid segregation protein ParM